MAQQQPLALIVKRDRREARTAAAALRRWLAYPESAGEPTRAHIDLAFPRRALWLELWPGLPGLVHTLNTDDFTHTLLPGWRYTRSEIASEMIHDLDRLAQTGERPTEPTR